MSNSNFPCQACGASVEAMAGRKTMICPFCGTLLTVPEGVVGKTPETTSEEPATNQTVLNLRLRQPGTSGTNNPAEDKLVDYLRQSQPAPTQSVAGYGLGIVLRRYLPGCFMVGVVFCLLVTIATAVTVLLAQTGG